VKTESENQILPHCLCALTYLFGCVVAKKIFDYYTLAFKEHKGSVSSCCLFWASYSVFSLSVILEEEQSSGNQTKPDLKLLTKSQLLPPLHISGSGRKEAFDK